MQKACPETPKKCDDGINDVYYINTNMVGEAKGKVRNASDILASEIQ